MYLRPVGDPCDDEASLNSPTSSTVKDLRDIHIIVVVEYVVRVASSRRRLTTTYDISSLRQGHVVAL